MQMKTLSAGVVITREQESKQKFLILRCFRHWDFPKGEVDVGEAPLDAACREVREETGLSGLAFRWGEAFVETPPYGQGKVARYYLAESPSGDVDLPINPALGYPEHHEFRWVTAHQAEALLNERLRSVLRWALARLHDR